MIDLGWENSWYHNKVFKNGEWTQEPDEVPEIVKKCRALGHRPLHRSSPEHRGLDNVTTCEECGYLYHTDSSD